MKSYNFFREYIKNRNVLYIPIISCINRDTNEYNLAADGNVNRFITTFSICNTYKKLTIILPSKHIRGSEEIINKFKNSKIDIIYSNNFGIHAGEQRNKDEVVLGMFFDIQSIDYDICIFESQKLGLKLINTNKDKEYIFWNPVSKVNNKTRIFLEGYDTINAELYDKSNYMIIASPDQREYYSSININFDKLIYLDKLIDRDLEYFSYEVDYPLIETFKNINKKIFYLPFRLTDEGYKFDKVIEYLNNIKEDFIVLYTDPNNSHIIDKDKENEDLFNNKFIKVSSNRNTYYTILDYIPCTILYFEDLEFINHAAIHEFMNDKSKCEVILYNQNKNPYNVNSCKRIKNVFF